ncbi:ExeA family protein [Rubripirellula obstinata]|nr:AAA family ATPase [Rubripirellula obstinata]
MTQASNANGNDQANTLPPFPAFPSASRYVPIGSVDEAMVRIGRSIDAKEAISLIMGPPGTGKSLICQTLTRRYENSHDVIVLSNDGIEDRDSLLRHVLHCMKADHVAGPTNDLYLTLVDRVCSQKASHGGLLIIVDEAQSICTEVLEAIRKITNIMQNGQPRVSAILCGGAKLDEVLVDPSMEAFTQRVATRCYLHPFSGDESREYITAVIAQCDADPDRTITLEAISAVHHACSGVPRLINQLMTQAIDVAEEMGQSMIDDTVVDRAWAMLQQLPSPMIDEPKMKATSSDTDQAVEYGELSDWDADECSSQSETASCKTEQKQDCDISVGTPSATWLEDESEIADEANQCEMDTDCDTDQGISQEAIAQIASPENTTPPASALFGDFESEEHVPVGSNAAVNPVKPATMTQPTPDTSGPNLESMLHQEIVGMTTQDDSAMIFADHSDCSSFIEDDQASSHEPCESNNSDIRVHSEAEDSIELEIVQAHEDAIAAKSGCGDCSNESCQSETCSDEEYEAEDHNAGALRFVEEADADPESDPFEIRLVRDDSDLLVIEDELDLQGDQKAPLSEEDRQDEAEPVAVDYQQLMSRMRTGS